jgi:putative ABC transport system ATP-binding protein
MKHGRITVLASCLCKIYQIGAGKSTLLNVIGVVDIPTSGKIVVFGHDLRSKNEDFLADLRCLNVGFVFQFYNLISTLTVSENVAFPMEWTRKPENPWMPQAKQI